MPRLFGLVGVARGHGFTAGGFAQPRFEGVAVEALLA